MSPPNAAPDGAHAIPVVGHVGARAALAGAIANGRVVHALLIVGPPAVGKRTLARWFAQALLCPDRRSGRPCGGCRACRLVAEGHHADLDLEHEREPLRIDGTRALQHTVALAPAEADWRVAIVGDVDAATPGAANALLKTLEEPPAHAVLILTASDEDAVLPTIRSRCRRLRLRAAPLGEVVEALVADGAALDEAARLARWAAGRVGRARALRADPDHAAERAAWLDALAETLDGGDAERLAVAARLARGATPAEEGLATWCAWWRDVLMVQHGVERAVLHDDRIAALRAVAARLSPAAVTGALRACEAALRQIAARASTELALDVLVLDLPSARGAQR